MFIPLSILLLLGCSARINENRVAFDGFMFNSKLKVGLNKKDFEITVLRANRSLREQKKPDDMKQQFTVLINSVRLILSGISIQKTYQQLHPATQYLSKVVAEYEDHEVCGLIRIFEI